MRTWIGAVSIAWENTERSAAIIRVATGRGTGDALWGQYVLSLRWIGDPPPAEIACAVYDLIRDGGPGNRRLPTALICQARGEDHPSYQVAQA